jgi:hypothetical protein
MLKSINVRFFTYALDRVESLELMEITEGCFKGLTEQDGSRVTYERHTMFANGCHQVCLTVETVQYPDIEELETV